MANLAKEKFPEIDFEKCIMVGDSFSDMEFGKKCGMLTFYVSNKPLNHHFIDFCIQKLSNIKNFINL